VATTASILEIISITSESTFDHDAQTRHIRSPLSPGLPSATSLTRHALPSQSIDFVACSPSPPAFWSALCVVSSMIAFLEQGRIPCTYLPDIGDLKVNFTNTRGRTEKSSTIRKVCFQLRNLHDINLIDGNNRHVNEGGTLPKLPCISATRWDPFLGLWEPLCILRLHVECGHVMRRVIRVIRVHVDTTAWRLQLLSSTWIWLYAAVSTHDT
jgi:hypothetical protein